MNDEIKEILDKFDKVLENYELDKKWGQMSVDSICHLFPSEMVAIKDYITNLQEENEYSNHCNEELRKKITNLEYKIERLEEDNKELRIQISAREEEYIKLQEELEEEKRIEQEDFKVIQNLEEENKRLKELCDKYEEEHSTTFEEWQKAIKENESLHIQLEDRAYEQIKFQWKDYKSRIDKANQILQEILVVSDWEHEGKYRPVKNTTAQDVYKTIVLLNEILETPHRRNYGLLQGEDKDVKDKR